MAGKSRKIHNTMIDNSAKLLATIIEEKGNLAISNEYVLLIQEEYKLSVFDGSCLGEPIKVPIIIAKIVDNKVLPLELNEHKKLSLKTLTDPNYLFNSVLVNEDAVNYLEGMKKELDLEAIPIIKDKKHLKLIIEEAEKKQFSPLVGKCLFNK